MSWNYRVVKVQHGPEASFGFHEVYYNSDGSLRAYSAEPVPVYASSIEDLQEEIERFIVALRRPILTDDDFHPPSV